MIEKLPFAYLITFTCYGARLHGDSKESVDRHNNIFNAPYLKYNSGLINFKRKKMHYKPYTLNYYRRNIVLSSIKETCQHYSWHLFAAHVRSNHVHIIVSAKVLPNIVMTQFKARASYSLNQTEENQAYRKRWTRHGSTRYLWSSRFLIPAMQYVVEEQGQPMSVYHDPDFELDIAGLDY